MRSEVAPGVAVSVCYFGSLFESWPQSGAFAARQREWIFSVIRPGDILPRVVHVLEKPQGDWNGERGFVTAELFKRHLPPPYAEHDYFICGPDVMMDASEQALQELDVPLSRYHSERYSFVLEVERCDASSQIAWYWPPAWS